MCSTIGQSERAPATSPDRAAQLAAAIDECAVAVTGRPEAADHVAARLASAWELVNSADPELAARTAQYARSTGGNAVAQPPAKRRAPQRPGHG